MLNNYLASEKLQPLKVLGAYTKRICGFGEKIQNMQMKKIYNTSMENEMNRVHVRWKMCGLSIKYYNYKN